MNSPDASSARTLRVTAEGRSLHLREWGRSGSETILLIHGIPSNGLLWRDVAPQLSSSARVLAVDLLGYGRSDSPGGRPVDIVSQAGYLVAALQELGLGEVTVVGHDIGGGVAQILAVRHPGLVKRLGLVNSVCYDSWPIPEMKAIQKTAPLFGKMPAGFTAEALKLGLRRGFVHPDRADDFLDLFLAPFSTPEGLDVFVEHARSLDSRQTQEVAPSLGDLRLPAAVVWGRQDPFQKVHYAERLAADIPGAELTLIDEASHFAPADAPDAVAEALRRLLKRDPAGTPDR